MMRAENSRSIIKRGFNNEKKITVILVLVFLLQSIPIQVFAFQHNYQEDITILNVEEFKIEY